MSANRREDTTKKESSEVVSVNQEQQELRILSLIAELQQECARCKVLLDKARENHPVGAFEAFFIAKDVESAEAALTSGDVTEMVAALKRLKGC